MHSMPRPARAPPQRPRTSAAGWRPLLALTLLLVAATAGAEARRTGALKSGAAAYVACGGMGGPGARDAASAACSPGHECARLNKWFWQCLPAGRAAGQARALSLEAGPAAAGPRPQPQPQQAQEDLKYVADSEYEICGGRNGPGAADDVGARCPDGQFCIRSDAYFWQCRRLHWGTAALGEACGGTGGPGGKDAQGAYCGPGASCGRVDSTSYVCQPGDAAAAAAPAAKAPAAAPPAADGDSPAAVLQVPAGQEAEGAAPAPAAAEAPEVSAAPPAARAEPGAEAAAPEPAAAGEAAAPAAPPPASSVLLQLGFYGTPLDEFESRYAAGSLDAVAAVSGVPASDITPYSSSGISPRGASGAAAPAAPPGGRRRRGLLQAAGGGADGTVASYRLATPNPQRVRNVILSSLKDKGAEFYGALAAAGTPLRPSVALDGFEVLGPAGSAALPLLIHPPETAAAPRGGGGGGGLSGAAIGGIAAGAAGAATLAVGAGLLVARRRRGDGESDSESDQGKGALFDKPSGGAAAVAAPPPPPAAPSKDAPASAGSVGGEDKDDAPPLDQEVVNTVGQLRKKFSSGGGAVGPMLRTSNGGNAQYTSADVIAPPPGLPKLQLWRKPEIPGDPYVVPVVSGRKMDGRADQPRRWSQEQGQGGEAAAAAAAQQQAGGGGGAPAAAGGDAALEERRRSGEHVSIAKAAARAAAQRRAKAGGGAAAAARAASPPPPPPPAEAVGQSHALQMSDSPDSSPPPSPPRCAAAPRGSATGGTATPVPPSPGGPPPPLPVAHAVRLGSGLDFSATHRNGNYSVLGSSRPGGGLRLTAERAREQARAAGQLSPRPGASGAGSGASSVAGTAPSSARRAERLPQARKGQDGDDAGIMSA
ncbi:MAG: hypothetical protein J3K34DRAFT_525943 [Monoraphidium minutum]|nr:MAG: hypothetical protein J3K34DRAFT_525943 [Monoraphidium minutum]